MFIGRIKTRIVSIFALFFLIGTLVFNWLPFIPAPHALALTTEILKPTDYTFSAGGTNNDPTYAYDTSIGGEDSTYNVVGVGDNNADPTIEYHPWQTSTNNHSERRLYILYRGRNNGAGAARDLWSLSYSINGGADYTIILEGLANTAKETSPVVYIPDDLDLSQLVVKIATFLVGANNNGHVRVWDVWLECDFTSFHLVGTQISGSYPLVVNPTTFTPQQEWTTVTVPVWHGEDLSHIDSVEIKLFFDSAGTDPSESGFSADAQTCAVLTWTRGGGPEWDISPAGTTWAINSAGCSKPGDSSLQGNWVFSLKVGKVATYSDGSPDWDIFAEAVDYNSATSSDYLRDIEMNWYGEVSINTVDVVWDTVAPGIDFGDATKQTDISVTYISNGPYYEKIATSGNWTSGSGNAALNISGAPGNMEFSIKADNTDNLTNAVLITAYPTYVTINNTGTQTGESGTSVTTNTLWLKLGAVPIDSFSGVVYYMISDSP